MVGIDMTDRTAPRHLEGHVRWPPMRYMILVHASPGSESGAMPTEQQIAEQLAFHQAIDEAGILIDAMGFHPTSDAWRVQQRTDGSREVIEGPFHDEHLIAGYTLIDVASREEAMDWSLRYAKTATEDEDGEIEVRRLFDLDEFVQGPALPGGLLLEGPEGAQVAVSLDHPLDGRRPERADQLVLEILDADVEAESLQVGTSEVGSEPGPLQAAPEVAFLGRVAEAGEPDPEPLRSEVIQEPSYRLRAADRDDRDALGVEVPPVPLGKDLDRDLVADPFDEDDCTWPRAQAPANPARLPVRLPQARSRDPGLRGRSSRTL